MLIKSLHIQDFQSHKDTKIEFDKNVTAIIGLNNHGKSAVLKALTKVMRNDPKGNSFVRNLPNISKKAIVTITTDKDNIISRSVGSSSKASDNMYKVDLSDGEKFEFTKFNRTGIPEEVVNAMNISLPQVFGDTTFDLNIHKQFEPAFLIQGNGLASIRSKILGRITGVDLAQKAIQMGKTDERNLNQDIEKLRVKRENDVKILEKYKDLTELEILLRGHDDLSKELIKTNNTIINYKVKENKIQEILLKAGKTKNVMDVLVIFTKNLNIVLDSMDTNKKTINILKTIKNIRDKASINRQKYKILDVSISLEDIIDSFNVLQKLQKLSNVYNRLKVLENIKSIQIPDFPKLSNTKTNITFYEEKRNMINNFLSNISLKDSTVTKLSDLIVEKNEELKLLKKELKVCPTCGMSLDTCIE